MQVQHNMSALGANRALKGVEKSKLKCLEKLSSGYRLNRAADDAAGLSVSEKMRGQIRGLDRGVQNVEEGISYVQVADAALAEVQDILHRIEELAVQAANDTNTSDDRECLDAEVQMLKEEIDRIFTETEYNTIKIWDTENQNKVQIGTESKQAVTLTGSSSQTLYVDNTNKGAIAYGGYTIAVQGTDPADPDTYGFKVTWTGYDNVNYETELVSWDEMGSLSFSMNIADYMDYTKYPDAVGINYKIGWTMLEQATVEDIAKAVDGVRYSTGVGSSEYVEYTSTSGVSFSVSTNYLAELASDRNVEEYDTDWIEADVKNGTNVTGCPTYTDTTENTGWTLHFTMPGIGGVTATSSSLYYYSTDKDEEDEGKWWEYYTYTSNGKQYKGKSTLLYYGSATLAGVTSSITNSTGYSLTKDADGNGYVVLSFSLQADSAYNYCGRTSTSVGTITMTVSVYHDDTAESLMQRVQDALNTSTVIDVYEGNKSSNSPSRSYQYMYSTTAKTSMIDVPVYKTTHDLLIQEGANAGQVIHLVYESLRLGNLGIEDTNVLTGKEATQAIAAVQQASEIVSAQRSLFGAYNNRMEHAREVNAYTSENLQESESRIRDLDMADEIVTLSAASIIEQAIQAMLANANRQPEGILELLQGL
ncbi:MAG: hypothetical protein LUH14_11890 [Clostridiaceae bacterium]|nr:hypothetical protein [Clostridiaceae bacterium]